jgi:hypothetical protein
MLKVRFFLNEPNGKSCKHFKKMMPKLDDKYDIEIDVTSKPKTDYMTDEYFALDLPVAPAIMVGEEIITEGKDSRTTRLRQRSADSLDCRNRQR